MEEILSTSPGVRLDTLAGFASRAWNRPYKPDDLAAAWWSGLAVLLAVAAVPLPLYFAGQALFGFGTAGRRAALWGALLSVCLPAAALFLPTLDALLFVWSALYLMLASYAVMRDRWLLSLAAGFCAAAGLCLSWSFFWVIAVVTATLALSLGGPPKKRRLILIAIMVAVAGAALLLFWLLGLNWLEVWRVTAETQGLEHLRTGRGYWAWVVGNPLDFATFLGVGATIAALAVCRLHRSWPEAALLSFITITALMVLDFSGLVRAEVGRIWMVFMPFLLLSAGATLAEWEKKSPLTPRLVLVLAALQMLALSQTLDVFPF